MCRECDKQFLNKSKHDAHVEKVHSFEDRRDSSSTSKTKKTTTTKSSSNKRVSIPENLAMALSSVAQIHEGPKKKVKLDLSYEQIGALVSLGLL